MINVGQIFYVNVAPFFHDWIDSRIGFVKGPPRELARLARLGSIDAGPLPLYETFLLEDRFEPLGNFGIAAAREVRSVFLFSHRPIETLSGCRVLLTTESSTSVSLVKLLLHSRFGLERITYTDAASLHGRKPEAALMIGDKAMQEARGENWPHCYDLAALWWEWTGLPFTFARWVVRRTLSLADKTWLAKALEENLRHSFAHLAEVCRGEAERTGFPFDFLESYLRNMTFRLGPEEENGIRLFRERLHQMEFPV